MRALGGLVCVVKAFQAEYFASTDLHALTPRTPGSFTPEAL